MSKEKNTAIENESIELAANDTSATTKAVKPVPSVRTVNSILNSDGDTSSQDTQSTPFIDTLYQKISSVLGGNNPNQFLCLTIPGQALSPEDFTYDYKNNAPKGPVIEANESRLANKHRFCGDKITFTFSYQE